MRYVIQVLADGEWIDFQDRHGEKREYDDAATASNWISGALGLPGAMTYRVNDTEREEIPTTLTQAVLMLLVQHGDMTDEMIWDALQKTEWLLRRFSPQHVRTQRKKLQNDGAVVRLDVRAKTASGKTAAVWRVAETKK